jgi:murein DD-endopeptidase MepM/ murein hydrolase activator NlpD
MRVKAAGIFSMGFAAGMLCLAVGLLATNSLRRTPAGTGPAMAQTMPPAPAAPPDFSTPPPAPAPAPAPSTPPLTGEADRSIPEQVAKLTVPVSGVSPHSLSTNFTEARGSHKHEAIDIPAARGTPVVAAAQGNVVKLFTSKQGGLTVYQFDDSGAWCYYYAHLDRYSPELKEGMLLRPGEMIGYVGTSGDAPANAPHLHFAVFRLGPDKKWWKGTPVDPLPLLKGQAAAGESR